MILVQVSAISPRENPFPLKISLVMKNLAPTKHRLPNICLSSSRQSFPFRPAKNNFSLSRVIDWKEIALRTAERTSDLS